jgi:hypothetical protein
MSKRTEETVRRRKRRRKGDGITKQQKRLATRHKVTKATKEREIPFDEE